MSVLKPAGYIFTAVNKKDTRNNNLIKVINLTSGTRNVKTTDVIEFCEQNHFTPTIKEKVLNNTIDAKELLELKAVIRKIETIDMHGYLNIPKKDLNFLNCAFYSETSLNGDNILEEEINLITSLLQKIKPNIVLIPDASRDPYGLKTKVVKIIIS